LSKEQILKIAEVCEENSIHYNVYTDKEIIAKNLNYNVLYYHNENLRKPEDKRTYINIVPNMYEYIKNLENANFLKVTVCDEDLRIFNSIIKKIRQLDRFDILEVEYMSRKKIKRGTEDYFVEYYYTEITNENVNKWTATQFLMKKLNIMREEVVAIGDNFNDREMIENAGIGIVMGNSNPFLKLCGDLIVKDNNSDGVYQAIEKYIL
jgi:HAD superfamily hydrolase (TIGR01484 family)